MVSSRRARFPNAVALFAGALIAGVAVIVFLVSRPTRDDAPAAAPSAAISPAPATASDRASEPPAETRVVLGDSDPAEIFRRVFWRRPVQADRILHAERREVPSATSPESSRSATTPDLGAPTSRSAPTSTPTRSSPPPPSWVWFLAVEPSPELRAYLRDENAFGLVPSRGSPPPSDAPAWFAFADEEVETFVAPGGGMTLYFGKTRNILFARSAGRGFSAGAPAPPPPPPPATTETSAGRLPSKAPSEYVLP